jgi:hypothetical protein
MEEIEENQKAQHREFVHSTITRMNNNSFELKKMMVTIVGAFLAIYAANPKILFILIPIPLVILFWFLDTYYLQQERKFRGIYDDICNITPKADQKTQIIFGMNTKAYNDKDYGFLNVLFSISLTPLYITIIICLIIAYCILDGCFS